MYVIIKIKSLGGKWGLITYIKIKETSQTIASYTQVDNSD